MPSGNLILGGTLILSVRAYLRYRSFEICSRKNVTTDYRYQWALHVLGSPRVTTRQMAACTSIPHVKVNVRTMVQKYNTSTYFQLTRSL